MVQCPLWMVSSAIGSCPHRPMVLHLLLPPSIQYIYRNSYINTHTYSSKLGYRNAGWHVGSEIRAFCRSACYQMNTITVSTFRASYWLPIAVACPANKRRYRVQPSPKDLRKRSLPRRNPAISRSKPNIRGLASDLLQHR